MGVSTLSKLPKLSFLCQKVKKKRLIILRRIFKHIFSQANYEELRKYFPPLVEIMTSIEGSLEVKLLTVWTDEKQRWEEPGKRKAEERSSEKRKSQKKADTGVRKSRKAAERFVFPMLWGSESRLAR